ncbi:MAG: hypothetical protein KF690_11345 [Bacteroidetes bacterium]|nr:hypothetical protein [Bacteroidota bacterium]
MQSLWIFPLNRPAPDSLEELLRAALAGWQAHKQPVQSCVTVVDAYFVIVEALSDTSGCGIDWLQKAVTEVLTTQELEVLDAAEVLYQTPQGISRVHFQHVPELLANGTLTAGTVVYDHTCVHRGTLDGFRTPLGQTWLSRYLSPIS